MSVFTLRVAIRHEGQAVRGFPLTRRTETATQVGVLVDQQWPDNDSQEPTASTGTPFFALHFDKPVQCEMGSYTGLAAFALGSDGAIVFVGSGGLGFAAAANAPFQVQGVV